MKLLIAGGGIAGLGTGLALAREGHEVRIFERSDTISEVGAGLQMSPNGTRILAHLGLLDRFRGVAVATEGLRFNDLETGEPIYSVPLGPGAAARYGETFYQCHRADLVEILHDALPAGCLALGSRIVAAGQSADHAWVETADGVRHAGNALIGCDGIHSAIRGAAFGADRLRDSGLAAWRALIPYEVARDFGIGHVSAGWFGRGRAAVAYWVRPGELFNLVCIVPAPDVAAESWTNEGAIEALRAGFEGCNPALARIVQSVDTAFLTGFRHRAPLPSYADGRIALAGDAAHAMLPFLAQGGVQALEDGVALARLLTRHGADHVPRALAAYDDLRRPRATLVQSTAAAMASVWTIADAAEIRMRNGRFRGIIRIDPYAETIWGWLYRHDPVAAADEQPLTADRPHPIQRAVARPMFDLCAAFVTPADRERGISGLRDAYERLLARFPTPAGTGVERVDCDGVTCLIVRAAGAADRIDTLHLHGGGYVVGSAAGATEYAARLSRASGAAVLVVDYRLAPEHPFPAAVEDAATAYAWLARRHDGPIIVSGESAGAGLAVTLGTGIRDAGLHRPPAAFFLMSPYADLAIGGDSIDPARGRDPLADRDLLIALSGAYLQGADPADPRASPIHADLAGLAPMRICCSAIEALRSDAERLHAAAIGAGVKATLEIVPDTLHIFALFPDLPEASAWVGQLGDLRKALD